MELDFNYIPPEEREAIMKKVAENVYAPEANDLVRDVVQSEIFDDTKDMTAAERYDYLWKRLKREEAVSKQLQKQYEAMVKAAQEAEKK